jgi:hypothetical protein
MNMAPQDRFTFQPDKGFRELIKKQASALDRPEAWVVNRYIEDGLRRDGLLPPVPRPRK